MKKVLILLVIAVMTITLISGCGETGSGEESSANGGTDNSSEQTVEDEEESLPLRTVEISIKDYGTVKLELDPNEAPVTVDNFIKLAESGFYDGLKFHRIMDGFMIQGGANPDVKLEPIPGEFSSNGYDNGISHTEGVISMARTDQPNSATSQFFITVANDTFLDGNYAAFGYVTEGLDICKKIASDAEPIDDNGTIPEDQQPVIETIKVTN